ncbi:MAG: sigma-70 family RNA polymerase sigma factor [Gammaproteobacteria bacterium]|nr:sigma-70 family RNA polymerase sigma factor [Gammaproteobacteria bacterium]MCP5299180.1 sigma-70 family RNA polymerase sigma factor [Chromatiaceae bacterium]
MTETDEQLMARYRDGDAAAFDTLYRRHRGPVFRYVKRLAAAGMDAEALFQDAWMRVIQARTQWRRGESFRPWLYRIAHNRVVDELRRHGHVAVDDEHDPDAVPSATPDQVLVQWWRDCVERLMQLLGRLPETQRSAFLLREEAGLSLEQIGQVTGVGHETVKSRLRYAMRRLRDGLEGCDDG